MAEQVVITYPVHCPVCRQGLNMPLDRSLVLAALRDNMPIRAYAACHDRTWDLDEMSRLDLAIMASAFNA